MSSSLELSVDASTVSRVVSRRIIDADLEQLADFLGRSLGYPASYYQEVFARLQDHRTPTGFPKYGYILIDSRKIVGAMLQIYSNVPGPAGPVVRCHMASWCVTEEYRHFATLFFRKALAAKDVCFVNTSARSVAIPSIKAQGFGAYSNGQYLSFPLLNFGPEGAHDARVIDATTQPDVPFDPVHRQLLLDHAGYGCIAVWCISGGRALPFVFHERSFKGFFRGAQLVYCPTVADFALFAAPLGRYLAHRRIYTVRIDANGPVSGLSGIYFRKMEPRYFKGCQSPRLGDLAYTQGVLSKARRRGETQ